MSKHTSASASATTICDSRCRCTPSTGHICATLPRSKERTREPAAWATFAYSDGSCSDRRVALVLANYPNRDGRIGNGVGLDTPAGTITQAARGVSSAPMATPQKPPAVPRMRQPAVSRAVL